jgi:sugar lactone lactonase YvrE
MERGVSRRGSVMACVDVCDPPALAGGTVSNVRSRAGRCAARLAVVVGACATLGLIGSAPAWALPPSPVITDFAGISGSQGSVTPGPATGTTLGQAYAVAVDANGNVYIADYNDSLIEKVTPDGILSIVAGVQGASAAPTPGQATSSDLDSPQGVAIAPNGDLYIADTYNNMVEKVTPNGTLSVIAGDGDDSTPTPGPATSSPLGEIAGVAVDQAGNVYIADPTNNVVEKVTPGGALSIFAGNPENSGTPTPGPATDTTLDEPEGVAVDASGNVYIADYDNSLVEKVTPSGTLSIFAGISGSWGTPTAGLATDEPLGGPQGVATDPSGDVYIADYSDSVVEKVTPGGMLSVVAGDGSYGAPTYGAVAMGSSVSTPFGIAAEPDGTFFTADGDHFTVDRIGDATPGPTDQPTLTAGDGSAQLSFTPPIDPGTSAIISYEVSLDGGATWQTITTTSGQNGTLTATLTALSDGTTYNVLVSAFNGSGGGTASPQASVTPEAPPANSTPPAITGTPVFGDTLTADPGTWQGTSLTYGYQWMRDGVAILGATNATYVPTSDDTGHALSVRVTAGNDVGSASATSASVAALPPAPSSTSTPAPSSTSTPAPSSTSTPVAVTIAPVPSTGVIVNDHGQVMLTLVCPITPSGCDASGVLTIHLPTPLEAHTANVAGAGGTVLASFSGHEIASGQSTLVAVRLQVAVLRQLQRLGVRRVKVTLSLSNHLSGAPAVNSTQTVYLLVPALPDTVCPSATGQLRGTTLGPVTLGRTRALTRRLLPRYSVYSYHTDNYCMYDGRGIRVGYASTRLLGRANSALVAKGDTVFALSSNRHYSLDGVRPGTRVRTAARHLKLGKVIHSGLNYWYVIAGRRSNGIMKVRHGIILGVGIVNRRLTLTRSAQLQLLRNF